MFPLTDTAVSKTHANPSPEEGDEIMREKNSRKEGSRGMLQFIDSGRKGLRERGLLSWDLREMEVGAPALSGVRMFSAQRRAGSKALR